jgi:hypothetical protein
MTAHPIGTAKKRLSTGLATALIIVAASACATYRGDLDRAVAHYNNREYDRAVVLFEVLEPDLDSLSVAERARYAYFRGMSHFLAEQRRDARHWLGNAAAREKAAEGSLHPEEVTKLEETLATLNQERWGGATTPSATSSCEADADCDKGQFCDDGSCRQAPGASEGDTPGGEASAGDASAQNQTCKSDADCSGTLVCSGGNCQKP